MQSTVNYSNLLQDFWYAKVEKKVVGWNGHFFLFSMFLRYGIITGTEYTVMRNILQLHSEQRNDAKNSLMK